MRINIEQGLSEDKLLQTWRDIYNIKDEKKLSPKITKVGDCTIFDVSEILASKQNK